jgi:hypothetical protein
VANPNRKMITILLLTVCAGVFASTDKWQRFNSSSGFSVMYPSTWFRIGISTDRLQLLSSKGGAEGVIIKPGQAEITVVEARASSTKTLTQIADDYTQGAVVLSRRDIPPELTGHGCRNLQEVISKEQPVSPTDTPIDVPYVVNTDLFCEAGGHKIVTLLRNWEGDQRQEEYQRIVLRMAKSIRKL